MYDASCDVSSVESLEGASLSCRMGSDEEFSGPGSLRFRFRMDNHTSKDMTDCEIILNHEYRARLSDLIKQDTIPVNTKITFDLSHDVNNHGQFLNDSGEPFPRNEWIRDIAIQCQEGNKSWTIAPMD